MASDYAFVSERPYARRLLFLVILFFAVVLVGLFFFYSSFSLERFLSVPWVRETYRFFEKDIVALNPLGTFYVTFLGDLFFNPIPPELFFYASLVKGTSPALLLIASFFGVLFANLLNYFVGRRFSLFFLSFMSKKTVYRVRRYVNRYGAYAVFVFNVLPLPAPMLTFALGMIRYSTSRLFVALLLGAVIKRLVMIASYLFIS